MHMIQRTWFIGCTHFGHENMLKLAHRPFASIEEHDEALISNWNERVADNDSVYMLGDFSWSKPLPIVEQLKGNITWILGNHDDGLLKYFDADQLDNTCHYLELPELGPTGFVLCHYPIEDWNARYRGSIHLHAHTHQPVLKRPLIPMVPDKGSTKEGETPGMVPLHFDSGIKCNRFHVGVDATGFKPIELDELVALAREEV
jgi:calcineurin-like phosphoesterase family protein